MVLSSVYTWFGDERKEARETRVRLRSFFVLHVAQLFRSAGGGRTLHSLSTSKGFPANGELSNGIP
ncbi:MAG: hypothetical protein QW328_07430, partial [Nitrososphaerota archaeon]